MLVYYDEIQNALDCVGSKGDSVYFYPCHFCFSPDLQLGKWFQQNSSSAGVQNNCCYLVRLGVRARNDEIFKRTETRLSMAKWLHLLMTWVVKALCDHDELRYWIIASLALATGSLVSETTGKPLLYKEKDTSAEKLVPLWGVLGTMWIFHKYE